MVVFPRKDRPDVAINPAQIVAVYPATDAAPFQTCIVTTALTSFSASSGATVFIVDCTLEEVISRLA
jgi:hypothetical protein